MDPREIAQRLVDLMVKFCAEHRTPPEPMHPMSMMLGGAGPIIDPSCDADLARAGVGSVTPWIEQIGKFGYVGSVLPSLSGWLVFVPSVQFYEQLANTTGTALKDELLNCLFPASLPVPNAASVAVSEFQTHLPTLNIAADPELLKVVLRELELACQHDCRHSAIALCGKLLELFLGILLRRWERPVAQDATLATLIGHMQNFANDQGPPTASRLQARAVRDLGILGIADLIRTVRNGAVHAHHFDEQGTGIELPSQSQMQGVVLLTVDILKRFALP